jgi:hypothetical protein
MIENWSVVWNMAFYDFPLYWEFHHPNWRTPSFFRGVGINHQPASFRSRINQTWFVFDRSVQMQRIAVWQNCIGILRSFRLSLVFWSTSLCTSP